MKFEGLFLNFLTKVTYFGSSQLKFIVLFINFVNFYLSFLFVFDIIFLNFRNFYNIRLFLTLDFTAIISIIAILVSVLLLMIGLIIGFIINYSAIRTVSINFLIIEFGFGINCIFKLNFILLVRIYFFRCLDLLAFPLICAVIVGFIGSKFQNFLVVPNTLQYLLIFILVLVLEIKFVFRRYFSFLCDFVLSQSFV